MQSEKQKSIRTLINTTDGIIDYECILKQSLQFPYKMKSLYHSFYTWYENYDT